MRILYSIYLSFFRRWFGGGFDKLWDNRAFQNCFNVLVTFGYLFFSGVNVWIAIIGASCLQFLYFCPAHGCAFDMGKDGYPDDVMIKRYENYFWDKWCKFLIPENMWYGFWYDFLWMTFRYELPAILISVILGSWFWVAGLLVPCGYAFCWHLKDLGLIKRPIPFAEFISGFVSGLFLK